MVKLFVEGGGDAQSLKTECRQAFTKLIERAGCKGKMPRVIACGTRRSAFEQFCKSLEGHESALLLVDSEAPIGSPDQNSPWLHVKTRQGDHWGQPKDATDKQLHLMVECMESWFLADPEALSAFYGSDFQANKLPKSKPERTSKLDVYAQLADATKQAKTKGQYGKGSHSFKLLGRLDPQKIEAECPWAARFFTSLRELG